MTIPTWFIEAAIRGGWKDGKTVTVQTYARRGHSVTVGDDTDPDEFIQTAGIAFDPQFWRCLGNELGWASRDSYCTSGCGCAFPNGDGSHEGSCVWGRNDYYWKEQATQFIDLLLFEASPDALDAFWEGIKPKEL